MAAVAMAAGAQVSPMAIAGRGCSLALLAACLPTCTAAGRRGGHKKRTLSLECLVLLIFDASVDLAVEGEPGGEGTGDN